MPTSTRWLVFQHTSDLRPLEEGPGGNISPMHGEGLLAEHAADYVIRYADGSEARAAIRRRCQIGAYRRRWGENCFEAVAHHKPQPCARATSRLRRHGAGARRASCPPMMARG